MPTDTKTPDQEHAKQIAEIKARNGAPLFKPPTDEMLQNRYSTHGLLPGQKERYDAIRAKILDTAKFIRDNTPCCPDQSLAFGALDDAMFRANAAIARTEKPE